MMQTLAAQRLAFAKHGAGAGVDSVWEQEKPEARKMLENAARREAAFPSAQCIIPVIARDAVLGALVLPYSIS